MKASTGTAPEVEVRRSRRRTRTVSAYRTDTGTVVVLIPDRFSAAEEARWVQQMLDRLDGKERRRKRTDEQLARRGRELSAQYLQARAEPASIRWVDTMTTRWASCTPADRSIRVSERVRAMPPWVLDYVLLHELAHLLEPAHNARFWDWVDAYPRAERAKGYLEGVSAAASLGLEPCAAEDG
ncbi:MAG: YgjP-like metallopeptidase domain-containing protein [Marmoricola sp.]